MKFRNRAEAGQMLAISLKKYANQKDVVLLALPRGGVLVGYEIAKALNLPLDAFLVRKLGVPGQEELAFGALAIGNVRVFNEDIVKNLQLSPQVIEKITQQEQAELDRRNQVYRQNRPLPEIKNKTVILIDDGLATGATMRAAITAIKQLSPLHLIVAVAVASPDTYVLFKKLVDDIVCLHIPENFNSIGQWYEDFPQNTDEEICNLLTLAQQ